MPEYKKRVSHMFYILTQQSDFIHACDLSRVVGVTERTVKSDIPELMDYAQKAGAKLISKKGVGYRLIVQDLEKVQAVTEQLAIHFAIVGDDHNIAKNRVKTILRTILVEEEYLTQDDLAERLYISKRTILEDLKQVNHYLKQFNLRWKKKNESGPLIQGNELDKRMLMVCVYEAHFHKAIPLYKNDEFLYWFKCEKEQRLDIRQVFLRNLRESECHIRDDHTQRLSYYLYLMSNRVREGYVIELTDQQKKYIQKLKQYQISKQIMKDLTKYPEYINIPENETLAFGLLLAEWADVSRSCDLEANYSQQLIEAQNILNKYENRIKQDYGICLNQLEGYQRVIISSLIPLIIQKEFKACSQEIRITSLQGFKIKDYPLAVQMTMDISLLFEEEYGLPLSLYNVFTFASSLYTLFLSIGYDFKPIRSLVYSQNGLQSAYSLSQLLNLRYGPSFECLECHELYELRGLKLEDYDFVIADLASFAYRYDWPVIFMDSVPTQSQLNDLYNHYIVNNVKLDEVVKQLDLKKINIYQNFEYESDSSFRQLLCYKIGKDAKAIEMIKKILEFRSPICVFNKVCVMFVKRALTNRNCFDIYQLKSEVLYEGNPVRYFLIISFNFKNSLQSARFINDLIYMFYNDIQCLEKVIQDGTVESLVKVVKQSLKALPISLKQGK
ncbi:MAG: BglG family transcription antiterminator [Traorella sp.]